MTSIITPPYECAVSFSSVTTGLTNVLVSLFVVAKVPLFRVGLCLPSTPGRIRQRRGRAIIPPAKANENADSTFPPRLFPCVNCAVGVQVYRSGFQGFCRSRPGISARGTRRLPFQRLSAGCPLPRSPQTQGAPSSTQRRASPFHPTTFPKRGFNGGYPHTPCAGQDNYTVVELGGQFNGTGHGRVS